MTDNGNLLINGIGADGIYLRYFEEFLHFIEDYLHNNEGMHGIAVWLSPA